ncbi:hypothetical protein OE88DRAFT_1184332 [Heliocybe sulcata]|uniref:Uncharacterized protein n=1 Tax=Heliocybe sulcata TaxID=5364 RepID=A0A5C3N911_9AGAM|nr:hypothetical protein OE88DRAFT_1184332 [Heliocybe sulcata]
MNLQLSASPSFVLSFGDAQSMCLVSCEVRIPSPPALADQCGTHMCTQILVHETAPRVRLPSHSLATTFALVTSATGSCTCQMEEIQTGKLQTVEHRFRVYLDDVDSQMIWSQASEQGWRCGVQRHGSSGKKGKRAVSVALDLRRVDASHGPITFSISGEKMMQDLDSVSALGSMVHISDFTVVHHDTVELPNSIMGPFKQKNLQVQVIDLIFMVSQPQKPYS